MDPQIVRSSSSTDGLTYLAGEGPVAGLVRYVGVSGVGRRRVGRLDERVIPPRRAGPLRHDAEVRETVVFGAKRKREVLRGFNGKK